jgi:sugar-specific transcriptional regulator TrmB
MVSTESDRLITLLSTFGLEDEEAKIYEFLLRNGQSSASDISHALSIPRTTIYRLVEKLVLTQIAKEVITPKGRAFEAGSIEDLSVIVKQRESELDNLKDSFKEIKKSVSNISIPDFAKTKILSYKGIEGLKQITWNSKNAKGELRIIEKSTMDQFLDYGFSERTRTEFLLNKVHVKEITNATQLNGWTDIKQFVTDFWECKYIPASLFEIRFEILIYNDVYAMYNYENNDIVGIEIYNQQLSNMQRQLFDFLWSSGKQLRTLDGNGKSAL